MGKEADTGLVFSGGGSRGSYQIGVWQAMIDMGISDQVCAVYGTSVGAINGAAYVQGDFDLARELWHKINYTTVFANLPKERPRLSNRKLYMKWLSRALRNKGVDVSPLKKTIRESVDEDIIRASPIDYGLVTFDLKRRKAVYLTKDEIPQQQLAEYIIASATFPVFQPHRIADKVYLDGGIADNRPIAFVNQNEYIKKIIVVDVTMARHIWPQLKVADSIDICYVRPSRLLGSPLSFNHDRIMSNLELGYRDGRKQLARLRFDR